jgi:hypothetical protein
VASEARFAERVSVQFIPEGKNVETAMIEVLTVGVGGCQEFAPSRDM